MKNFIILTTSTEHLAKTFLKAEVFEVIFPGLNQERKRYFPDGEVYLKTLET